VNWIWFGFGVLAIGSIIALLPEGAYAFAASRIPAGAATTTVLVLLLLPAVAFGETLQGEGRAAKSELRRQLEGDIMCTCGCRAPMNDCPMGPSCHGLQTLNPQLDGFLAQGMTRDQVRAAFVAAYGGQHVLTAPIDQGFNRLAWLFPYMIGITGATVAGVVAFRWSRRDPGTAISQPPAVSADDGQLRARLDDELRDLD
jgi:hypothetical protein